MAGLYAANGTINVTVVSGASITGKYAVDGSWNVVQVFGGTFTGLNHPCGALNVFVTAASPPGYYAACGAMNVSTTGNLPNTVPVTVVSGSLTSPTIDLNFAGNTYFGSTLAASIGCVRATSGYVTNAD